MSKENLMSRKMDLIFECLVEIMRDQKNPLWKEFAEEYDAINKKLDVVHDIRKENVENYIVPIPGWM